MRESPLLLQDVDLDGHRTDVRVQAGTVIEIGPRLRPSPADEVVDGAGGALLPGLHDHHIHLLALAAAQTSVRLGPPDVTDAGQMRSALRRADAELSPREWLRAFGYHESVAGDLTRGVLDAVVPSRPVRVQHRSGMLWVLNSAALAAVGTPDLAGFERDRDGLATGRLFRLDDWLADRIPHPTVDLAAVGDLLTGYGVTGVTDATPVEQAEALTPVAAACAAGRLPQHVVVTGGPWLDPEAEPALPRGPVKLVLDDARLPTLDTLVEWIRTARLRHRAVALHCVTRAALVAAVTALQDTGTVDGDRLEHAAVVPVELIPTLGALNLTVVTQPSFVAERGDHYLTDVEVDDRPHLWRCGSLLAAAIPVGGSTDAPFGNADPWRAMSAATRRLTPRGNELGPDERVSARQALDMFLSPLDRPGGPPRQVKVGHSADLCLLAQSLNEVLADLAAAQVVATIVHGTVYRPTAPT